MFGFQLIDIADGFMSLMTDNGETRDDIRLPDNELGESIQKRFSDDQDGLMVSTGPRLPFATLEALRADPANRGKGNHVKWPDTLGQETMASSRL